MLKNSTSKFGRAKKLIGRTVHEVEVFLPKNIEEKSYYCDRSRLTGMDYMQLLEPPPIQVMDQNWDEEDLKRQAELRRAQIARDKLVAYWCDTILADAEKKKKINFSDYYFKILQKENDYEAAVKVATESLRELSKKEGIEVIISEEMMLDPKHPYTGIWKMQTKNTGS
jgi:hypothetical protein